MDRRLVVAIVRSKKKKSRDATGRGVEKNGNWNWQSGKGQDGDGTGWITITRPGLYWIRYFLIRYITVNETVTERQESSAQDWLLACRLVMHQYAPICRRSSQWQVETDLQQ